MIIIPLYLHSLRLYILNQSHGSQFLAILVVVHSYIVTIYIQPVNAPSCSAGSQLCVPQEPQPLVQRALPVTSTAHGPQDTVEEGNVAPEGTTHG